MISAFKRLTYLVLCVSFVFGLLFSGGAKVFAARPDSFKDTLSDSRVSQTNVTHTIVLDISSGSQMTAGTTITFTWPSGFTLTADATWATTDFTFNDGTARTIIAVGAAPTCTAGANNVSVTSTAASRTLMVTACGSYTSGTAGAAITFVVGVGGTHGITNATAGTTYQLNVTGTGGYTDSSQDTVLNIIAAVTASATIDEVLTFTVNAVTNTSCPTTGGTATTSTATTIPWGTAGVITTEAFWDTCQDLRVATNAGGGYAVTDQTTTGLDSGSNAFAVGSCNGACTLTTPNVWTDATLNGYAVCMQDQSGKGTAASNANAGWNTAAQQCGGATQKFELVADKSASETASTIMTKTSGASDDRSYIGWRISADAAQAAGAYTGTVVYIATATF